MILSLLILGGFLYFYIKVMQYWPRWRVALFLALWSTFWGVYGVFQGNQVSVAINVLVASYWWRVFWKNRPRGGRDKVAKLIGAKAKAIKDKIVAAMPKAAPVRVPQLAPVGA